jgi:Secretion system C-terminal sorting domain
MKKYYVLILLSFLSLSTFAQQSTSVDICSMNDSFKTNKIWVSTGINHKVSDSSLYGCGYGGNTFYTTPNLNVDSFWIVSKLSSMYNPRHDTPFHYTGVYLNTGDNPYIICTLGYPVQQFWPDFTVGGGCTFPGIPGKSSSWLSIYSEGGGQNSYSIDSLYDGYEFERCFALCNTDSLHFNLKMMADDIIDSVIVDDKVLYATPVSTNMTYEQFFCAYQTHIDTVVQITGGRHFLKVWARDIFHGHLGLNVYGNITANSNNLIKTKYDIKCTTHYDSVATPELVHNVLADDISITPNPNNGKFSISLPETYSNTSIEIYDFAGRKCLAQNIYKGNNTIDLNHVSSGVYFIKIYTSTDIAYKKVVIQ